MSSMPFPSGTTWNFEVVPVANGVASSLVNTWWLMTFQTSAGQPQMVLQVGLQTSPPVNVTWLSTASDVGTITSNPSFTVDGHIYAFNSISVLLLPVSGTDHRVSLSIHLTVDGSPALFAALPNTSGLLPPKVGNYDVTG